MVASMPAGSLVGSLAVSWFGEKLGRKKTIALSGFIWVLGSLLQCASQVICNSYCICISRYSLLYSVFPQNRGMLVVGRIIGGFAIGVASTTVYVVPCFIPLLISDVSLLQTHVPS